MKILVINCGSSSVKYELFEMPEGKSLARGLVDRVGVRTSEPSTISIRTQEGKGSVREVQARDHKQAVGLVLEALSTANGGVISSSRDIAAVGHRVVHGGERFTASALINVEVISAVEACSELAPLHNPPNLQGIMACDALLPDCPQVAVFDTAFHSTMPSRAYLYAIPAPLRERYSLRRFGFHGTSHHYVHSAALVHLGYGEVAPPDLRVITCHLGNGCSMCAIKGGKVLDTSMGFTPLEGLIMGTRSGDIDPAAVTFLQEKEGLSPAEVAELLNRRSGLLGLSGRSSDMRDLLAAVDEGDQKASSAVEAFCYRARKYVGAYLAVLNGLDVLIFTAGIGENSPQVRLGICADLDNLGIILDAELNANAKGLAQISRPESPVKVLIVPTNEELMIARETTRLVGRA